MSDVTAASHDTPRVPASTPETLVPPRHPSPALERAAWTTSADELSTPKCYARWDVKSTCFRSGVGFVASVRAPEIAKKIHILVESSFGSGVLSARDTPTLYTQLSMLREL